MCEWVIWKRCKPKQTKVVRSFLCRYPLLFSFSINICYSTDKNQIFYCFTGLSYSDVKTLNESHFIKDEEGRTWIKKHRVKTGVLSRIPLLPIPKLILENTKVGISYFQSLIFPLQILTWRRLLIYVASIRELAITQLGLHLQQLLLLPTEYHLKWLVRWWDTAIQEWHLTMLKLSISILVKKWINWWMPIMMWHWNNI